MNLQVNHSLHVKNFTLKVGPENVSESTPVSDVNFLIGQSYQWNCSIRSSQGYYLHVFSSIFYSCGRVFLTMVGS